jgi:hypothetical protein
MTKVIVTKKETHIISGGQKLTFNLFFFKLAIPVFCPVGTQKIQNISQNRLHAEHNCRMPCGIGGVNMAKGSNPRPVTRILTRGKIVTAYNRISHATQRDSCGFYLGSVSI